MLTFIACAESDFLQPRIPINLDATENSSTTRGGVSVQGASFDSGERLNAYIKASSGTYIGDPIVYTTSEVSSGVNKLTPDDQPYYPTDGSTISIAALYPSSVSRTATAFSVNVDQSSDDDYKASDLMFASISGQSPTSDNVHLQFGHKMAKIIASATGDGVTVTGIRLLNVNRTVGFTPETGAMGSLSNQGAIDLNNGGAALIPPQTVTNDFLEVSVAGTDSKAKFALNGKNFQAGKVYTLNVTISNLNLGSTVTISNTDWPDNVGVVTVAPQGSTGMAVHDVPSHVYQPSPYVQPKPVVTYGENTLSINTDYDLQYFDNDHVGTATILVVGKGKYSGLAAVKSFTITQATGSLRYTKSSVTVDYSYNDIVDNNLIKTGDGTMTYTSTNQSVAKVNSDGQVVMQGIGSTRITATMANDKNYTGASASFDLTINGKAMSDDATNFTVTLSPTSYVYSGSECKPTVTLLDNGQAVDSKYYDVAYANNVHAGEGTVIITGKASYAGTINKKFTINKATPVIQWTDGQTITQRAVGMGMQYTRTARFASEATTFGSIKYKSGTTSVATVGERNGQVTASSSSFGTAKITAYVETNSYGDWEEVELSYNVVVPENKTYYYTGKVQTYVAPVAGYYTLEVVGAQGGNCQKTDKDGNTQTSYGGLGGKVKGRIKLDANQTLYVYVGGHGSSYKSGSGTIAGGWNGGGNLVVATWDTYYSTTGGGATDISLDGTAGSTTWNEAKHLYTRLIVAGGGGGALEYYSASEEGTSGTTGKGQGGGGGGVPMTTDDQNTAKYKNAAGSAQFFNIRRSVWEGQKCMSDDGGGGGSMQYGGRHGQASGTDGTFGIGGSSSCTNEGIGAGGGGWYGGGGGGHQYNNGGGGGGSSYLWSDVQVTYSAFTPSDYIATGTNTKKMSEVYPTTSGVTKPADKYKMELIEIGEGSNDQIDKDVYGYDIIHGRARIEFVGETLQ